jgi:hypothetical protein
MPDDQQAAGDDRMAPRRRPALMSQRKPPVFAVIFACARIHGLNVAHDDTHFDALEKLEAVIR